MDERRKTTWKMPAEWMPHAGTWVAWPHNRGTWPRNLQEARKEFSQLTNVLSETDGHAYVCLNGADASAEFCKQALLNGRTILCDIRNNDAWARDYAPTFVVSLKPPGETLAGAESAPAAVPWFPDSSRICAIDWHYNAWGGKYPPFDDDQRAAQRIARETNVELLSSNLCLEGGAIEVNQSGTLLTTRSCVLNKNRNPDWSVESVECEFKTRLGVNHIVWLSGDAILGDDTDGHIDQLARFVNDTTIVYAWTNDRDDPQFSKLNRNLQDLKSGLNRSSLDYELIPLPLPRQPVTVFGQRLPASYCNFYITNEAVIVPQFDDLHDGQALSVLDEQFPKRNIIGLPSRNLMVGLGSFHCLTQQMPKLR